MLPPLQSTTYLDSGEGHSGLKTLDDHASEEDKHGPAYGVDEGEDAEVGRDGDCIVDVDVWNDNDEHHDLQDDGAVAGEESAYCTAL